MKKYSEQEYNEHLLNVSGLLPPKSPEIIHIISYRKDWREITFSTTLITLFTWIGTAMLIGGITIFAMAIKWNSWLNSSWDGVIYICALVPFWVGIMQYIKTEATIPYVRHEIR